MIVDTRIQEILDFIASRNLPPHYELPPAEGREGMEKARAIFGGDPVELPRVEDRAIPGPAGDVPIRIYAPEAQTPESGAALPVLVFFHGGGWVLGSLDTHDDVCRHFAKLAGCMVIAVDYRLAPEHKFPAAVEDCTAALEWIAAHGDSLGCDPARLAVGGDSAGGNLAAVMTQLARERGGPTIAFQLLIYPVTARDFSAPSMKAYGEGFLLTKKGMHWFMDHYLNDPSEGEDPRVAPLKAESLVGLPPALVVTVEYDVLRDEGEAYARRLAEAGVAARLVRYDGLIHGFLSMTVAPRTGEVIRELAAQLKKALA